jgi:hypothetical protein
MYVLMMIHDTRALVPVLSHCINNIDTSIVPVNIRSGLGDDGNVCCAWSGRGSGWKRES